MKLIMELKENFSRENKFIVETVKANNEKYIKKMGQTDQKISQVLSQTEVLLDQYKKNYDNIKNNLESTKRFREDIMTKLGLVQKQCNKVETNCDKNHTDLSQHLDRVALKFAGEKVNLSSAGEGFERELERRQILFRELQQEFLTQLEEKRQHNEALLRGAGIEEKELRKAKETAKNTSNKNLAMLLPKLQATHVSSNLNISTRQDKILAILKSDRVSPTLNNSPTSRKFFTNSSDLKVQLNADIGNTLGNSQFIPGGGSQAFITQTPTKRSSVRDNHSDLGTFKNRKASQNPSLPPLDFLSRQEENKGQRYEKGKSVKNINSKRIGMPAATTRNESQVEINDDFAKLHSMGSIM